MSANCSFKSAYKNVLNAIYSQHSVGPLSWKRNMQILLLVSISISTSIRGIQLYYLNSVGVVLPLRNHDIPFQYHTCRMPIPSLGKVQRRILLDWLYKTILANGLMHLYIPQSLNYR